MSSIDFCYSKDGGRNWSDWRKKDLGATGAFLTRLEWLRLGLGRQWVFKFRVTDPVRADILAGAILPEPTDS